MSVPLGRKWVDDYWDPKTNPEQVNPNPQQFRLDVDNALGSGQTIYLVEDVLNQRQPVSGRKKANI